MAGAMVGNEAFICHFFCLALPTVSGRTAHRQPASPSRSPPGRPDDQGAWCVFRSIVTDRFGIVTAKFGNVTDCFGDVTDGVLKAA